MSMKKTFLFISITILLLSCEPSKKSVQAETKALISLLTGSFSSSKQAKKDTSFYNVSLHMYPIWLNKKGEHWLYVEQGIRYSSNRPSHQRIYKIERLNKDLYESQVYTLPNPKRFIGKWNAPDYFNQITPDSLTLREGCSVYLRKVAKDYYRGATKEGTCESTIQGAAFITSEVEVFADKIIAWDRGLDKEGKYIWGAEKGGYIFNRKK